MLLTEPPPIPNKLFMIIWAIASIPYVVQCLLEDYKLWRAGQ